MNTIRLTDTELRMARNALQAYLQVFGHDEADVVREIKSVIAKFRDVETDGEEPRFIA